VPSRQTTGRTHEPGRAPKRRLGVVGAVALIALIFITINTIRVGPGRLGGIQPGSRLPPFAAPLASGSLTGLADIATHPDSGAAGRVPACAERGPGILNVCQLYERHPTLLALFVDAGGCASILPELQRVAREFPSVRVAAVSFNGHRDSLRRLIRRESLTFPVAIDEGGRVASLYEMTSCPQLNFAYPGGVVQSKVIAGRPSLPTLRRRTQRLVEVSR
jgi:hypothetical protein